MCQFPCYLERIFGTTMDKILIFFSVNTTSFVNFACLCRYERLLHTCICMYKNTSQAIFNRWASIFQFERLCVIFVKYIDVSIFMKLQFILNYNLLRIVADVKVMSSTYVETYFTWIVHIWTGEAIRTSFDVNRICKWDSITVKAPSKHQIIWGCVRWQLIDEQVLQETNKSICW